MSPCFCPVSSEGRGTRGSSQPEEGGLSCGVSRPPTRDSATQITTVTVYTVTMTTPGRTLAVCWTVIRLCYVSLWCSVFWLDSSLRLSNIGFMLGLVVTCVMGWTARSKTSNHLTIGKKGYKESKEQQHVGVFILTSTVAYPNLGSWGQSEGSVKTQHKLLISISES